jgi:thiamine pyrophosphate-dependent acetolactate synthase large subunit-like protein
MSMPLSEGLSAGEALVGLLESYEVDTVFGIPGVHNVELYRALPRSRVRHILPRHEQGAGFMADGYARATGKPGVCFTITGPGLTNILTPLGQAYSDSVPLLVISSCLDIADAAQGRGRLHEMIDQAGAASSVSRSVATAFTPADLRDKVAEAFARFASQRPRPCYIEVPIDVLKMPAGEGWTARPLPHRPRAAEGDVEVAARLTAGAKRPVLIVGGGARAAGKAVLRIAEATAAVIFTTIAGKGAVPADHPLCAGAVLANAKAAALIEEADVVLAAGTEIAETDLWRRSFAIPGRLVRIDIDPDSLARPYAPHLPILADAAATLEALAARMPAGKARTGGARAKEVARLRAAIAAGDDELQALLRRVLAAVRTALPADSILVSDMTQIAYAANEMFPMDVPSSYLHPVGFGTLGYALPAAIGARAGEPFRPVVALAGDYGFQYTLNELGTAVELGGTLIVLLWNNNALAQIRDDMVQKGIQPNAVSLRNPDFSLIAKAYGIGYERPENLGRLAEAIGRALAAGRPFLIEMTPEMAREEKR